MPTNLHASSDDAAKQRRRVRERFLVTGVILLILVFGFLEGWFFQLRSELHPLSNVFLFALININVILLLLLAYLILRNIAKLLFERKKNILGHRLRTRLVCAFVGLALIPTVPLFWMATQFIFSSLDYWFSRGVEESLEQAVSLARDTLDEESQSFAFTCTLLGKELADQGILQSASLPMAISRELLERYRVDGIFIRDDAGTLRAQRLRVSLHPEDWKLISTVAQKDVGSVPRTDTLTLRNQQEALVHLMPYPRQNREGDPPNPLSPSGVSAKRGKEEGTLAVFEENLIFLRILPARLSDKLAAISSGHESYLQLKLLHAPFKQSHFIIFSIVTLLVIFVAVWFGFFLAKNITTPLQALLGATQRIAEGDLSVQLDAGYQDEIGMLITSFNKMVRDLRESREKLDKAYCALQESHSQLEERRRTIETILSNVAAGVVSVDAAGRIITLNGPAQALLEIDEEQAKAFRGRSYTEVLQPAQLERVQSFLRSLRPTRQASLEQQVQLMIGGRLRILLVKASLLRDEENEPVGAVIVLDDLTEFEKAQRMAAWREVAQRIAHEVKNPLTPIQLCAQRLRRKYSDRLAGDGAVLEECTGTIIQQVERMKGLVDEFSRFARLPRLHPVPCDLGALVQEVLALYRHSAPHVNFSMEKSDDLPPLKLDPDGFRQVLINILDNALHAVGSAPGTIAIRLSHDRVLHMARLECADSGHGLSDEDKVRMFEPYYSTKEKGTGLGLAIVASIVADHNGFIRVRDNESRGTVIVIELPA